MSIINVSLKNAQRMLDNAKPGTWQESFAKDLVADLTRNPDDTSVGYTRKGKGWYIVEIIVTTNYHMYTCEYEFVNNTVSRDVLRYSTDDDGDMRVTPIVSVKKYWKGDNAK